VGIGGLPIWASEAGVTLIGAPWTLGTTSVATGNGTVFRAGFVHGPLSATQLSSAAAPSGSGVVQLVTSSVTTSGPLGTIAGFGTLTIHFVPEPGALAGLLSAAALLGVLGRRRMRRRR
jgi:hypothetical protein